MPRTDHADGSTSVGVHHHDSMAASGQGSDIRDVKDTYVASILREESQTLDMTMRYAHLCPDVRR